jgi:acetyltransferase-like isoleucine patch superfamily enzyme
VRIITSNHIEAGRDIPILHAPIEFAGVVVGEDGDIGVGATLLPGTRLGRGVQVGAGAVVKGCFEDYAVIAGVPARVLRKRK